MLRKLLSAALNFVITLVSLGIIIVILGMLGLGAIGGEIRPFVVIIALLVGALTFFGMIPNYWQNPV